MVMDSDLRVNIAIRLAEERTRLGFAPQTFANITGITPNGLRNYENGQRRVPAAFLAEAARFGLDAQYVLTGERSGNWPPNATTGRAA